MGMKPPPAKKICRQMAEATWSLPQATDAARVDDSPPGSQTLPLETPPLPPPLPPPPGSPPLLADDVDGAPLGDDSTAAADGGNEGDANGMPSILNLKQSVERFLNCAADDKPRPFANALVTQWGQGSCYINAALQVLFASHRMQQCLAQVLSECRFRAETWKFLADTNINGIREKAEARITEAAWSDATLALTLAAAMQGSAGDGRSLRGRPLFPALFLRECYGGPQEDSMHFLLACLERCPRSLPHCTGRFHPAFLQCAACGQQQAGGGHADEQLFTSLQVQTHCKDSGDPCQTVQNALHASWTETLDDDPDFTGRCPSCPNLWKHKSQTVQNPPAVLLVSIKQWAQNIENDGSVTTHRRSSGMRLDETVQIEAATYSLHGVIFHQGLSPGSGHYVAVARHGVDAEPFFLYNDACRRAITRTALVCDTRFFGEHFHATGLLYDRVG